MDEQEVKVAIVTNIPSPYRVHYFDTLARILGNRLFVIYCAKNESNRSWSVPEIRHNHIFLDPQSSALFGAGKYAQRAVWKSLKEFSPNIVITGGFNPTMLIAIIYSWVNRIHHAINTDAWELNEKAYKWYHILLRRIVYRRTRFFFPISSKGAQNLVSNYGVSSGKICTVPYVINQDLFKRFKGIEKKFDLLFSGQFIERKMPFFFADVCHELSQKLGRKLNVAVLGNGPLKNEFMTALKNEQIEVYYPGFVQQDEIPEVFCSSRFFLFPTLEDGWGVVANEAVAAGVPCVTCDNAGAAGDIIKHGQNGFILPLKSDVWAELLFQQLTDTVKYSGLVAMNSKISEEFDSYRIAQRFLNFIGNAS